MNFIKKRKKLFIILGILVALLFLALDFDISAEKLKETYANEYSKFVEIDGMMVHYRDQGTGVPIVLLHGSGGSLQTWEGWTEALQSKYRVISVDLPAFGLTGPHSRRDYSIDSYIKFLSDFVNTIGLESFHIAGNSLGGYIAYNYELVYPNKIKKMILLDAAGYRSKPKKENTNTATKKKRSGGSLVFRLARIPVIKNIFLYFTPKAIIRNNLEQVYYDDRKVTEALVKQYHDFARRAGNRQAFMDRLISKRGGTPGNISDIKASTLILWGEDDRWISVKAAYGFHKLIENSQIAIMKETGHLPMEERPEESVKIALDFLAN